MTPGPHVLFIDGRLPMQALLEAGIDEQAFTSSWLVLGRRGAQKNPRVHVVPAPLSSQYVTAEPRFAQIASSDPWTRYFGGNADHYHYYYEHIKALLQQIRPNLVIGGMTHFHELLSMEACRESAIPYAVPVSAGESLGRFFCYRANTFETIAGSGDIPRPNALADYIAQHAVSRISLDKLDGLDGPGQQSGISTGLAPLSRLAAIRGAKFCLPSLLKRRAMVRLNRRNLNRWNAASKTVPSPVTPNGKIKILFPLQLQPDPAIDVWGARYSDQAALLERLTTAVGDQATIFVKSHPNASCEMSNDLLEVVHRNHALVPLASRVRIQDAFSQADLIVTVTETIAFHAILAGKPCATLVPSRNDRISGCRYLSSPEKLASLLYEFQSAQFHMHGPLELAEFITQFFAESYEGVIPRPSAAPQALHPENSKRLVAAFGHLAAQVAGALPVPSFRPRAEVPPALQEGKVERKAERKA